MSIDDVPNVSMPLWRRILGDLRARLVSGEFDLHFPSDREIVEFYKVSRHTAREAVRALNQEGLLNRGPGRGGTTVRQGIEFRQPLGAIYSLFRAVESQGVEQSSIVKVLEVRRDPEKAVQLGRDEDSELVYLERVRLAGYVPLALDRSWLPADVARPILASDFSRSSLYGELQERCGVLIDGGEEEIMPGALDISQAIGLETQVGAVALFVQRSAYYGGLKIEIRETVVRGDRYAFVVSWSSASGGQVIDWGSSERTLRRREAPIEGQDGEEPRCRSDFAPVEIAVPDAGVVG